MFQLDSYNMSLLESSSHRALACYDVLIAIFDHFLASEDAWFDYDSSIGDSKAWYSRRAEAERRATLARCARVCRAFSAPAIAVLWKDIDTLSPLVNAIGASDGNAQVRGVYASVDAQCLTVCADSTSCSGASSNR